MPQPTKSDVHVNVPLTNISIAFLQNQDDFIATKVFPNVPVKKQSDRYFVYPKGQWFRSDAQTRGLSQESAGSGYEIDNTPNYYCDVKALHKDIDDQVRANEDTPLSSDRDGTEFVFHHGRVDWIHHGFRHHTRYFVECFRVHTHLGHPCADDQHEAQDGPQAH
jgi:hypothetical protein